ncbi:GNAT family N-acetyltransferase [Nocardioides dongxiaopingii]|uniref:GNAT family N-acetyltransferase n=1 Tax=Nocardioides sp. S-1144 TaxID=2582905 RepID=UPI001C9E5774|nr:GNAT family N-acetyltransferase [Nocardioides sp. S-1144]
MGRLTRPTLRTARIVLEPLTLEHTDLLVGLDSDPEVLRHIWGRALSREEVVGTWMARRTRPDADARALGYWVGHDATDEPGRFLGWWSLGVDDDPTTAELGYRLRRDAWGRGYATEGARALLAHAFDTVGLASVWAETMAVNAGSRGVLEKLGLTHVGTEVRRWADPLPGWEQGEVRYEVRAEDRRANHDV